MSAFVQSLGCYDEVVTYDRVTSLPPDSPVAYVDMAGNSALRETLHRHFGEQMKYSGRIGLTHRSTSPDEGELPGAKPTWFFAPDQIRKRAKEWGPGGVEQRFGAAWSGFVPNARPLAQGHRKPRAGRGETGLSRYPQRPCSAPAGTYPLACDIAACSPRPFWAFPNGYRLRIREKAAKTAGGEKRACWTRRTDIAISAESWLAEFESALAKPR